MTTMTKQNADEVLRNIGSLIKSDEGMAEVLLYQMNEMLDGMLASDAFGSEGQNDPRGDHRDEDEE